MSSPPTFMKVMNTLKRRVARGTQGVSIEEMQQAAGQVLADHTTKLRDGMLAAIDDSREMIVRWKASGDVGALLAKLTVMASQAEEQGRIYGNALLTEVGARLSTFMTLLKAASSAKPNAKAIIAIELHLDAMIVALDQAASDKVDEPGRLLLKNLELTQRIIG